VAVLTYSEIAILAQERAGVYVSSGVDAPVDSTALARFINSAYAAIYEASGSRLKTVASATAWTTAQTATGQVAGVLTDIADVLHVWASTVSGSVGISSGDVEIERAELSEVLYLRGNSSGMPTYLVPKKYAVSRLSTTTVADVNKLQLDYWPGVTGFYLPTAYARQFAPIDAATVTTPDVNDLESRDIALLAAAQIAPIAGRAEFVPAILADLSNNTQLTQARRIRAMLDALQDA
jgi:hypothetical protein